MLQVSVALITASVQPCKKKMRRLKEMRREMMKRIKAIECEVNF